MERLEPPQDRHPGGSVPWPFERIREGQSDFLRDARETVAGGKHLLAHAPTGIGKTAVALVAALEYALAADKLVLFLTSRQSQHRMAVETVRRIEAKGPRIPTIDLISKHSMCLQEGAPSQGRAFQEFCDFKVKSRTCTFFVRDNSAIVAAVLQRTLHVQELIRASGACRVCPHRVAMDAAARSRLVVCDYNYVFSDIRQRFLPRLERSLADLILIIDEAHNLPDRIRTHLTGDLGVIDLLKAAKEARSIDGEVAQELVGIAKAAERFLTSLRAERMAQKEEFLDVVEEGLRRKGGEGSDYTAFVERLSFAGEDASRRGVPTRLPEIAEFFARWRDQSEGILRLVVPGDEGKFAYRLLDPSVLSRSVFDGVHASILMSGTLFPADMYADLLGIGHRRRVLRTYPSPFPRENRLLLVSPHVTTLFVKRGRAMHDAIAKEIADIASVVPGNVAAFFPSYELLEEAHRRVRAAHVPKRLLVERSEWSKTQRDGALEALRLARAEAGGALLLGVQGGSLSEGVDYHDNLLAAVIIVGLPLTPPSVEGEALRDYYARKFGFAKGHEYAVVYPAMNRLLQAAGRAIRSERDRAAIIILEGRLLEPRYARCLPPEFAPTRSETAASDASQFLRQPLGPGSSPPSTTGAGLAGT